MQLLSPASGHVVSKMLAIFLGLRVLKLSPGIPNGAILCPLTVVGIDGNKMTYIPVCHKSSQNGHSFALDKIFNF